MRKRMIGIVVLGLAALMAGLASAGVLGSASKNRTDFKYAIGLWGDLPYSDVQAQTGVPNLIADMNTQDLAFTVHDGDLKQGSGSPCDDALYVQGLGYLNALNAPAAFTPGDNDWTDCDRPANGGFNSLERLDRERHLFFSTPFTQG
jgi:hypothetical protein